MKTIIFHFNHGSCFLTILTLFLQFLMSYIAAECFPSVATVKVENGRYVTMSELQIGDRVQTGTNIKMFYLWPHQ